MNETKSPSESALWDKILQHKVKYFMKNSPMTSIKEVVANTEKDYLEQKWISLIDTDKYLLTIDQYIELGNDFGPDLTAISRSRFDPKLLRNTKNSAYINFRKSMKSTMKNEDIIKKWKEMSQEEKDKFKTPIQDES